MWNAVRLLAAVAGVGTLLAMTGTNPTHEPKFADPVAGYVVSGPYTHDNLAVFLLHGDDTLPARPVKTLDEALAAGTAVVHETGTVNTLCVENLSADDDLMIQNGDILKGGKQDRVAQLAMILPPNSGKVAMPAFCVEQGRWQQRGGETVARFAANPGQIAGKDLKLAVNSAGVQGQVWENVAAQQKALSDKVGKPVNGQASPTSLQLALEDKDLQAKLAGYRDALAKAPEGKTRVVGYAIAVNGKVTGAEVFGSRTLLAKAWPKAIQAAAVEALAEKQDGKQFATVNDDAVTAFLADAGRGEAETPVEVAGGNNLRMAFHRDGARVQAVVEGREYANPTLGGRSVATRDVLVRSNAGRLANDPIGEATTNETVIQDSTAVLGSPTNTANTGTRSGLPALPTPLCDDLGVQVEQNALRQLAGNPAPGWQVGHRQDIALPVLPPVTGLVVRQGQGGGQRQGEGQVNDGNGGRGVQPASAIQAPPVMVNRTAGKNGVMVESRDRANPGVVIHRTFIAK